MTEQRCSIPEGAGQVEAGDLADYADGSEDNMLEEEPHTSLAELRAEEVLKELYRPITEKEPWVEQLGGEWPAPDNEAAWLETVNDLIEIGSDWLPRTGDRLHKSQVFKAREKLLAFFPIAYRAYRYQQSLPVRFVPPPNAAGFVATQRLLRGYGINVGSYLVSYPMVVRVQGKGAKEKLDALENSGLNSEKLLADPMLGGRILLNSIKTNELRIRTVYGIVDAWGWSRDDAKQIIEEHPKLLGRPAPYVLLLGRICTSMLRLHSRNEIRSAATALLIAGAENIVTAYLTRDVAARITPLRLASRSKQLQLHYTREQMRGHIATYVANYVDMYIAEHTDVYMDNNPGVSRGKALEVLGRQAMRSLDPVVRHYLRIYPISEEEAKLLPRITELSQRESAQRAPKEELGRPEAYKTFQSAPELSVYIDYLRKMQRTPGEKELGEALDAIKAGLECRERNPGKKPAELEDADRIIYETGIDARQRLTVAYGALLFTKLGREKPPVPDPYEAGKLTDGILKLMIAILNLSRRNQEGRPSQLRFGHS